MRATQFVPVSVEGMARQSDVIAHGVVAGKTCQRDDRRRIFTRVELRLEEVWKGEPEPKGGRLFVVQAGGVLGDERTLVAGEAEYRIGEEVVVFLRRNQRGEYVTVGLGQGKLAVRVEQGTSEKTVPAGLSEGLGSGNGELSPQATDPTRRSSLDALKGRIMRGRQ